LEYAPICRKCDAYQCKRCLWLNRKTTLEINTPSHEQCVIAHLERNKSLELLLELQEHNIFLDKSINEIDYLDPFDIVEKL
ncbi:MAG: CXXX repeat peptide maturase, partial [Bacteroidales bacterium]|jgi:CXXX repeat peptide maturase|nr:CXXX repeat peptide maturase [Bacteroidales bacterium]